ncbi:hypothetical protein RGR602_PB00021 (plasmid) [Rhizobium gallicum bv. gallicum R602sp]|uniref:Uncharacterized protein n=1 Tax=Rhizobium gallicum bv. gallicum R602sp TaxID=1041138 RepID=A0A0B4XAC7_9HYPH|nr:hypothetical protein RGR602_PB00021 [Rhizobium gallicum bv. gallicum R602sp]
MSLPEGVRGGGGSAWRTGASCLMLAVHGMLIWHLDPAACHAASSRLVELRR